MINNIAAIGGREKDWKQYEQLLQRLAELMVLRQLVTHDWPFTAAFALEADRWGSQDKP